MSITFRSAWGLIAAVCAVLIVGVSAHGEAAPLSQETSARMQALLDEHKRGPDADMFSAARTYLEVCAASKEYGDRQQRCDRAQKEVDTCNSAREDWRRRKVEVLAEVRRDDPNLGANYTPGVTTGPGPGRPANVQEGWNDLVKALSSMDLGACPYTLPQTFLTPAQALAKWAEEDAKAGNLIANCDGMRRDINDAFDGNQVDRASGLVEKFETSCARQNSDYEGYARMYRKRLAEMRLAEKPPVENPLVENPLVEKPAADATTDNPVFSFLRNAAREVQDGLRDITRGAEPATTDEPAPSAATPSAVAVERSLTPGEQCAATEASCQTGCIAIAAVGGFLSIFGGGGRATASATGEQVQQCSNRCTESKSSCDEQVAAAARPAPGPSGPAGYTGGGGSPDTVRVASAASAGKNCRDVMNSLIEPVNDRPALGRLTPVQAVQESVWAMQTYVRVANSHPACANDAESRQQIANHLRTEQARCRAAGAPNCQSGRNFTGTAARTEAAIGQLFQSGGQSNAAQAGSANTGTGANIGSGTNTGANNGAGRTGRPLAECQGKENASDIGRKLDALPNTATIKSRGVIAASDFMIATYSQCLPDPTAQQIVAQYRTTRANTLKTCRQLAAVDNCQVSPF